MVKKTLKTLSQEDLELWKKITVQLKRNNPEVLIKNNISGFKIKKIAKSLPKAPELKPFFIGEKVSKKETLTFPDFNNDNKKSSPNMDKKTLINYLKVKWKLKEQ